MIFLAILYKALNIYSHNAHNLCSGDNFLQDHSFLGEIYDMADGFYDDIVERYIGTVDDKLNLHNINIEAAEKSAEFDYNYFKVILNVLNSCLEEIEKLSKTDLSCGTINLIQGQADQIEQIAYRIKRRLK